MRIRRLVQPFQRRQARAERERERRWPSRQAEAGRALYSTAAWLALRAEQLAAHPICQDETGCTVLACQVDHRRPHRGDPRLFFDRSNLRSLCASHHSRKTRRDTGAFGRPPAPRGTTGLKARGGGS